MAAMLASLRDPLPTAQGHAVRIEGNPLPIKDCSLQAGYTSGWQRLQKRGART